MANSGEDHDCFKEEFKRFKKRTGVDMKDVIDFRQPDVQSSQVLRVTSGEEHSKCLSISCRLGLKPPSEWKIFTLPSIPGLLVIPDPFLTGGQHQWVWQCLVNYPQHPNICNLDAHMKRGGDGGVWPPMSQWQLEKAGVEKEATDTSLSGGRVVESSNNPELPTAKRAKVTSGKESLFYIPKDGPLYKLRWVTLGYHYDWTTKEYYSERQSPFPRDLGHLSHFILQAVGFPMFVAEAGIVNYYHLNSTLSGHTDHSEKDLTRPLLSISFGQSAIFLIGGKTKSVRPKALFLNSGDVIIMSGESRLAYHGVPKILSPPSGQLVPECLSLSALERWGEFICDSRCTCSYCSGEKVPPSMECPSHQELMDLWSQFMTYLSMSRINVNVRQVVSDHARF